MNRKKKKKKTGTPEHETAEHGTREEQWNTPEQWWNN